MSEKGETRGACSIDPGTSTSSMFNYPLVQTLLSQLPRPILKTPFKVEFPIVKRFEDKGKLIIAGYASVEVIDRQNEKITIPVLKEAWANFSKDETLMIGTLMHSNIVVIKILSEYKDSKGQLWKSGVDDTGLFIVAEVREDIEKGKQTRELIEKGVLSGFSIGGEALASSVICEGKCYTNIEKMELHEIAVVDRPANAPSVFTIVKRDKIRKLAELTDVFFKQEGGGKPNKDLAERLANHFKISEEKARTMIEEMGPDKARELLPEKGSRAKGIDINSLILASVQKFDKAIELISKKVERRGNKWCVVHCKGPKAGQPIKCFPGTEEGHQRALAMHRAIQVKKDDRPPKAGWDTCMSRAGGIASIKDPEAFCGNLWFNDRAKWNTFIKGEEDEGCIISLSIKKLDEAIHTYGETRRKLI